MKKLFTVVVLFTLFCMKGFSQSPPPPPMPAPFLPPLSPACTNIVLHAGVLHSNTPAGTCTVAGYTTGGTSGSSSIFDYYVDGFLKWEDSTLSNVDSMSFSNLSMGYHTICVYVTANHGTPNACMDSQCVSVYINAYNRPCSILLGFNYTESHTLPDTFHLNAFQAGGNYSESYQWNITNASGVAVSSHIGGPDYPAVIAANGNYNACVIVKDSLNCRDTLCYPLTVAHCTSRAIIHDSLVAGTSTHYLTAAGSLAAGTQTYLWSNGATTSSIGVNASGTYCVTVYNGNCIDTACKTITIATPCSGHAVIHDSLIAGTSYHYLTALGSVTPGTHTYLWSTGATTQSIGINASGTYCVTVYNGNCLDTTCRTITIAPACTGHATIVDSTVSGYHKLYAYGSNTSTHTYNWSTGATTPYIYITSSGTYCVTVYTGNCLDTICKTITIAPNCTGHAVIRDSLIAGTSYHYLTALGSVTSGTHTYLWSTGATTQSIGINASGTYCVTVYNGNCLDTTCRTITIAPCAMQVSIHDTLIPTPGSHYLSVNTIGGIAPYTYHWNDGSTTSSRVITTSGNFCVTVTSSNGCTATVCDSVHILPGTCVANYTYTVHCDTIRFTSTSTASNTFTRLWDFGDSSTATVNAPFHVFAHTGNHSVKLTIISSTGCTTSVTKLIATSSCQKTDTICGTVFNDLNGNGIKDSNETGIANAIIYIGSVSVHADSFGHYSLPVAAGTYSIRFYSTTAALVTIPLGTSNYYGAYSTVVIAGGGHHCGYDFGVKPNSVTINGFVYIDANNNNVFDSTETPVSHAEVMVGTRMVFTNQNGFYTAFLPVGTYTVNHNPALNYHNYICNPATYTVAATTSGNTYSGNNFAYHSTATSACNIVVKIYPHTTVTPNFPTWYDVVVYNFGSSAASGTVQFTHDSKLIFNYAYPTQTSYSATLHQLNWNYTALAPGSRAVFHASLKADTTVRAGYNCTNWASATVGCVDSTLADNVDTLHQMATSSWDPNSLVNTPAGRTNAGLIPATQEMRYLINFQNTGTAPAVNVVLNNTISSEFDITTLQILESSHPNFVAQVENNKLTVRYSEIMLPDSNINEAGSHGWFAYSIKPVAGISPSTQVLNTASINFDYNDAVATNTTLNTIDVALTIHELENGKVIVLAMPNPFKTFSTIQILGAENEAMTLEVMNLNGQLVQQKTTETSQFQIDRNNLSSGIYLYQVKQNNVIIGRGKLIAE